VKAPNLALTATLDARLAVRRAVADTAEKTAVGRGSCAPRNPEPMNTKRRLNESAEAWR
jgi:hypothetical protein